MSPFLKWQHRFWQLLQGKILGKFLKNGKNGGKRIRQEFLRADDEVLGRQVKNNWLYSLLNFFSTNSWGEKTVECFPAILRKAWSPVTNTVLGWIPTRSQTC